MKKLVFAHLLCVLICFACIHKNTINCVRPYSAKELALVDSIKNEDQSIDVNRFNYAYSGDDTMSACLYDVTDKYIVSIGNVDSVYMNSQDSMRLFSRRIASKLYNDIVEKQILFYTEEFSISYTRKKYKPVPKGEFEVVCDCRYSVTIKKKDLENYFGFKIVESKKGFVRKKITKTEDSLIFSKEHYSCCEE